MAARLLTAPLSSAAPRGLQTGSGASSRCRGQDCALSSPGQKDNRPGDKFQLTFPLRTNYMYAKVKKSLPEMYAFTVCMWLRSSAAPGVGTPFSYAVPGQANELVLIEWGNNPMEILINDKVRPCPAGRSGTAEPGPLGPGPGRLLGQVVTPPHPPSALALLLDVEDHRGSGGAQVPLEVLPKSDLLWEGAGAQGQAAFFPGGTYCIGPPVAASVHAAQSWSWCRWPVSNTGLETGFHALGAREGCAFPAVPLSCRSEEFVYSDRLRGPLAKPHTTRDPVIQPTDGSQQVQSPRGGCCENSWLLWFSLNVARGRITVKLVTSDGHWSSAVPPPQYPYCHVCPSPSQVAKLPFVINDGKWHHICITWTTRDGVWEAYQDGTQGGSGENLAPYHPIKPQGVLVLGQEQVLPMGAAGGDTPKPEGRRAGRATQRGPGGNELQRAVVLDTSGGAGRAAVRAEASSGGTVGRTGRCGGGQPPRTAAQLPLALESHSRLSQ